MSEDTAAPRTPPPHSWLMVIIGLSVLGFVGISGVILIREFVSSRPVNLLGVSQSTAADIEEVLVANRVPRSAIAVTGPERREHPKAHWYFYEYDVEVPSSVSVAGLEKIIQQRMRAESLNLGVSDYFGDGGKQGLSISYGDVGVAVIRFRPGSGAMEVAHAPPMKQPTPPVPMEPELIEAPGEYSELPVENPEMPGPEAIREDTAPASPEDSPPGDEKADGAAIASFIEIEPVGERGWRPASPEEGDSATGRARLAIILDDGGYGGPVTESVLALPTGLTLAILPYTPEAAETAERAAAAGFEVMLHMPMENMDASGTPHEGQLRVDMSEDEITKLTLAALEQIPHVAGVNNHQGSRFTSDAVAMARFLTTLSRKPLYFVDSRTAASTKAYDLAMTFGMRASERDVFLDHVDEEASIRRSLAEAVEVARSEGQAIAIGHFRELTVAVLTEVLPQLTEDGVELVHASELVR